MHHLFGGSLPLVQKEPNPGRQRVTAFVYDNHHDLSWINLQAVQPSTED
jgi:hypothetical protein